MNRFYDEWEIYLSEQLLHPRDSFLESENLCQPFPNVSFNPIYQHNLGDSRHFQEQEYNVLHSHPFQQESCEKPSIGSHQTVQITSKIVPKKSFQAKKRKIPKPSPYHNFQKHLNSTVKQMIIVPLPSQVDPPHIKIAKQLWSTFTSSNLSTKKSLHFIFNEFNEYIISQQQLTQMGFSQIYRQNTRQELSLAKNYLSELAIQQLSNENIEDYLQTRRIKNATKFLKYLIQFRQQLKDRFIKKRCTNRSKKNQIQQILKQKQQI